MPSRPEARATVSPHRPAPDWNLVLCGFMGTGKTAVGRLLAGRLQRDFVDLDDLIVARAGVSIPELFARGGEAGFREAERAAVAVAASRRRLVIATGGGVPLDPHNLEVLGRHGILCCLRARPETIIARLAGDQTRPLLNGTDRESRIRELLAARAEAYARIPLQWSTDAYGPADLAARIAGQFDQLVCGLAKWPVNPQDAPHLKGQGDVTHE